MHKIDFVYEIYFVHKNKMCAYNRENAEKMLEQWYVVSLAKSVEE